MTVPAQRWGDDPKLRALLGDQGAAGFRALFDGFPELVGVLWAVRDADGRIQDFSFGYGNPAMLRAFRITFEIAMRYSLLEALPRMEGSRAFAAYVRTCDEGEPWRTLAEAVTWEVPISEREQREQAARRAFRPTEVVLSIIALAASYLPARRAARLDPLAALSREQL